jgi:hypothetical protein
MYLFIYLFYVVPDMARFWTVCTASVWTIGSLLSSFLITSPAIPLCTSAVWPLAVEDAKINSYY